ncbi:MAG TPA: TolC family protein, partial [Gemmataceae bacterium]|nr:TolC family protein [Gemmataceae bacterium]
MRRTRFRRATGLVLYAILASALGAAAAMWAEAQESAPARIAQPANAAPPVPFQKPAPLPEQSPLPINLPTALQLANAQALDIRLASERIRVAAAQLDRARTLWLPTIYVGTDYFRHDGQIQDVAGSVFGTSKQAFLIGAGPSAVFAVSDALFEPLAQRQVLRAREASLQTATNDTFLAVAEAYFTVQQARGELAGALDTARRAEELVQRVEKLGDRYIAGVEVIRARTELSRRRQAASLAR